MSEDSAAEQTVVVHRFGGRRTITGQPGRNPDYQQSALADLPPEAFEQLRLAHDLRNRLLDIEQVYDEAVAAAWAAHPQVARTLDEVARAQEHLNSWVERAKQQRKNDRTTRPRGETAVELRSARKLLREAKDAARDAKQAAYPQVNPAMVVAGQQRKAAIKALRQEFSVRGLYWGTSNDVIAHHNTAVGAVSAARKKGRPAALRRHRWDGSGTLTVQPQRATGDPPRTPQLLASGEGKWAKQLQVSPHTDPAEWEQLPLAQRRRLARGAAMLQVRPVGPGGRVTEGEQVQLPIMAHRMMPADADVVLARLTRRRVGSRHRLALSLTAKVPVLSPRQTGPAVAVHVGWRVRGDKSLRVATWVATEPITVPAKLAEVVRDHGGWGEVVLPSRWRGSHEHIAGVRAGRDKDFDRVKERLAGWLDEHGPVEVPGRDQPLTGADVRRWRSPGRVARLAMDWSPPRDARHADRWRNNPPPGGVELAAELEAWRVQDKHLWDWESSRRRKLEGERDDAWRRVAAWLGDTARLVVVDDVDIRDLARVPGVGEEDEAQARAARANRVVAAPGRLRELISVAAPRHGAALVVQTAAGGTSRHYRCGVEMAVDTEFASAVEVWCDTCGLPVDQDRNMAWMLLAASGQVPPPGRQKPGRGQ